MERIVLSTENVSIEFPGVKALKEVNFEVATGEIRAVVGANGAGKSTLMKVLSGAYPHYTGTVKLNGKPVEIRSTMDAKKMGVQIVYQEVDTALVPTLTVAENVMMNHMVEDKGVSPFVNWNNVRREARKILDSMNIKVNVRSLVQDLTLAQKQMVLIARAITSECNFLILDEPTAPLSDTETEELFRLVRHLRETKNIAIIFISHRINEITQICDKYTVMRNAEIVGTRDITPETTSKEIIEMMLGVKFEENFPKEVVPIGDVLFEVNGLRDIDNKVNGVSFYVRSGEIVGIAGLVGAGKSELCKTLFGSYKKIHIPTDAVKQGLALVPEERRKEGALVSETVNFNLAAASLDKYCDFSFVNQRKLAKNANYYVENLGIRTPSIRQKVANLSGGNQQKVVVGKWLAADSDVYIFDEPTKGVDVGAKHDIFRLIGDIAKRGHGVVYASCENNELLSLTDRIYVMFDGQIQAELKTSETNEDEIMYYAVGGKKKAEA